MMNRNITLLLISFYCLFLGIFSGCSQNTSPTGAAGMSQVSIGLGQNGVVLGALAVPGSIPANVRSFAVTAFRAGQIIAGPVLATLPQNTITMNVPNGQGVTFQLLAYDAAGGFGKVIYRGVSSTYNLNGQTVNIPIKINLAVTITSSSLQTSQGGVITFNGFVAGASPPATSPLLWTVTGGGTFGAPTANGASITWTAPNTRAAVGQTYAIQAKIDPAVNPSQDPNITGNVNVLLVSQINRYGFAMNTNIFTVNGITSSVDVYGTATSSTALAAAPLNIAFQFRDYTGNGAMAYQPAFSFNIREVTGLRRAIGVITPVAITTTATGQVSINVPANATLSYTGTSAAGTVINGTSQNILANLITTSAQGIVTLNINALLQTLANNSIASMNIFSSAGTFNYELGFNSIDLGHENATATGIDRLFNVGLNTSTRAIKGTIIIR
ncbi:MAG: hypothetical protein Q9M22_05100 [Mariprofundaceae bacterium]|nr:hypothetical protein [Mariprofundaceae bacterium]